MTQARSNRDAKRYKSADSQAGQAELRRRRALRTSRVRTVSARYAIVKSISDEYLEVAFVNGPDRNASLNTFLVAREIEQRRSYYEGTVTPADAVPIVYAYVDAQTRTATRSGDTKTHKVTPELVVDHTVILVERVLDPFGVLQVGSQRISWVDVSHRQWSVVE